MFELKERLKLIRGSLKAWHKNSTQNLEEQINKEKAEINEFEARGEEWGLSEEETVTKRELTAQMFKLSRLNCSIQWQKSRTKWLKEGDANSKYSHGCINKRRRGNEILSIDVEGRQFTEPEDIKSSIVDHF